MDVQKGETANDLPDVLPFELIIEILSRLPVEPLLHLKCVCKSWYGLINSPDFIKLHLSQSLQVNSNRTLILHANSFLYTLDFHGPHCHISKLNYPLYTYLQPSGRLVGSCNGLLCYKFDDQLALCNPLTQSYKIIPQINLTKKIIAHYYDEVDFAYDCISNDYKVLMSSPLRNLTSWEIKWETVLYSFRTNAWEIIANPPWNWNSVQFPGVVVSNSLHWMDRDRKEIRCFDLFTQRYFEIPLPEKLSSSYKPTLSVLRQQLFVITYYFDVWILKENGVEESWTRLFHCPPMEWNNLDISTSCRIDWDRNYSLSLTCSEDGCKILVTIAKYRTKFFCFDLASQEVRKIKVPGLPRRFSAILPWVPSLAPLSA